MKFGRVPSIMGTPRLSSLCPGLVQTTGCRRLTCCCISSKHLTPSPYLGGRVSGVSRGPVALRRADGLGDAAVIFVALRVRPPRRVAFLNGTRLLETPVAQQISHLKTHATPATCCSFHQILHHFCSEPRVRFAERRARTALSSAFKWQKRRNFQTDDACFCMRGG